ncbi:DUF2971 domain-containing protein [Pedosphaera parvula]|uniref:DUF2971 domain-containing protein n=1 Tax=Pedosphaera parvula (strain Ellin514) TaxID=320771 RepID=B9X9Q6_PEDPL|nr:DUF2971 domain-containing protein [Pedosphaera parvula]EEF63204.1 hypothetical protein Cflav_PD5839 [Pedosphaera parvula Ellin514]
MANRVPTKLYKFTSWAPILKQEGNGYVLKQATREALEAGYLYFSLPDDFDDPQDIQPRRELAGASSTIPSRQPQTFAGERQCANGMPDLRQEFNPSNHKEWRGAVEEEHKHSRMFCLAENWNNELMWALYGEDHRGICLSFDAKHPFFETSRPIRYSEVPMEPLAYCKSKVWAFQEEWRLVLPGPEPQKVPFPKETLQEIYLGYRFEESELEELKNVLVKGGYSVTLLQVRRIPQTFGFDTVKIGEVHPENALTP